MAKRILIFSLAYYPSHVSGAEGAIREITDRISPEDISFDMVTLHFDPAVPSQEKIGNVTVYRVGTSSYRSKIFFPFVAALAAKRLCAFNKYDAVWAMMTYMLLPVAVLRLVGIKLPHILTLQDGDPYEKVFRRLRIIPFLPLLNYGFRTASIVQVISKYLATWPTMRGYKGPVVLVHNGANPKDLKDSVTPAEVEELKQKLGKKEGEIWLANTARLVHQKGNDDTIRALPMLPENVKLLLVGGGEDEAMLKELTKELGLESRVIFTGMVDRSVVTTYRKAADIFVGPSRSEGLGNAFLSAMASRLPVVATQEGGLADFLFDEKENPSQPTTGWAVKKDSPEDIARAVKEILADSGKVKRVTETAREMVLQKYDWDLIAQEMRSEVFGRVLN